MPLPSACPPFSPAQEFCRMLNPQPDEQVLDVGCGLCGGYSACMPACAGGHCWPACHLCRLFCRWSHYFSCVGDCCLLRSTSAAHACLSSCSSAVACRRGALHGPHFWLLRLRNRPLRCVPAPLVRACLPACCTSLSRMHKPPTSHHTSASPSSLPQRAPPLPSATQCLQST